jgi:kynureninase
MLTIAAARPKVPMARTSGAEVGVAGGIGAGAAGMCAPAYQSGCYVQRTVLPTTRDACLDLDRADALAPLRELFYLVAADSDGLIYLDWNSLGPLPRASVARVQQVVAEEWGRGLIRSWNTAAWITLPHRIGDKIARVIGVAPGEVVATDATSVNLYKVLSAAAVIARRDAPARRAIVAARGEFPSDLYIADSVARDRGFELRLADAEAIAAAIDRDTAVVLLTHVSYRTGRLHDMPAVNRAAHAAGALVAWDLSHSAGALAVPLHGDGSPASDADFAVGCGYKYLNGGPGAPAFVWAHPRHLARMDTEDIRQPLAGWLGHANPFAFDPAYRPAPGIARFVCGTPPVLSLAALECGVDTLLAAEGAGGMDAIRAKSIALTDLFMALVDACCAGHGLSIVTPRDRERRGSQVSLAHAEGAYAIVQALIAHGVIGDFRAPDILRFGFAPLYTRFVDVWDAVDRLAAILHSGEWRDPAFAVRAAVT